MESEYKKQDDVPLPKSADNAKSYPKEIENLDQISLRELKIRNK